MDRSGKRARHSTPEPGQASDDDDRRTSASPDRRHERRRRRSSRDKSPVNDDRSSRGHHQRRSRDRDRSYDRRERSYGRDRSNSRGRSPPYESDLRDTRFRGRGGPPRRPDRYGGGRRPYSNSVERRSSYYQGDRSSKRYRPEEKSGRDDQQRGGRGVPARPPRFEGRYRGNGRHWQTHHNVAPRGQQRYRSTPSPHAGRRVVPTAEAYRRRRSVSQSSSSSSTSSSKQDKPMVQQEELTEYQLLEKLMGVTAFDTTKGQDHTATDLSAAKKKTKRRYRQYMNRRGGFNRPLSPVF